MELSFQMILLQVVLHLILLMCCSFLQYSFCNLPTPIQLNFIRNIALEVVEQNDTAEQNDIAILLNNLLYPLVLVWFD